MSAEMSVEPSLVVILDARSDGWENIYYAAFDLTRENVRFWYDRILEARDRQKREPGFEATWWSAPIEFYDHPLRHASRWVQSHRKPVSPDIDWIGVIEYARTTKRGVLVHSSCVQHYSEPLQAIASARVAANGISFFLGGRNRTTTGVLDLATLIRARLFFDAPSEHPDLLRELVRHVPEDVLAYLEEGFAIPGAPGSPKKIQTIPKDILVNLLNSPGASIRERAIILTGTLSKLLPEPEGDRNRS